MAIRTKNTITQSIETFIHPVPKAWRKNQIFPGDVIILQSMSILLQMHISNQIVRNGFTMWFSAYNLPVAEGPENILLLCIVRKKNDSLNLLFFLVLSLPRIIPNSNLTKLKRCFLVCSTRNYLSRSMPSVKLMNEKSALQSMLHSSYKTRQGQCFSHHLLTVACSGLVNLALPQFQIEAR